MAYFSHPTFAAVIDFEQLATPQKVTTQFSSKGVRFVPRAFLEIDNLAKSGTRVLLSDDLAEEFNTGPLRMEFTSGQSSVRMFARVEGGSPMGTLKAFDANGVEIGQDGPKSVSQDGYTTQFKISLSTATIKRVELHYAGSFFERIDDLEFVGEDTGPLPTSSPVVQILNPTNNQQLLEKEFIILGLIAGEGLLETAQVQFEVPRPPGSNAPTTLTNSVLLTGIGNQKTFSLPTLLSLGPQKLTVTTENIAGLPGTNSVNFTYLPQAIRDQAASEGEANLGGFHFGGSGKDCQYAVYSSRAIGEVNGQAFVVKGPIFDKWLAIKDLGKFPDLGCPISEERQAFEGANRATIQDFQKARIVSSDDGTFQVPTVFANAIDARDLENEIGIPLEDPRESSGAMQTWLFQRFRHPKQAEHTATLEIRGTPPMLSVQRRAEHPDPAFGVPGPLSPTLVEEYPCTTNLGPCEVVLPVEERLADIGRFCNHETYALEEIISILAVGHPLNPDILNPKEWEPIIGDHSQTSLRGIIKKAEHAKWDNPLAHDNPFPPCISDVSIAAKWVLDRETTFCPTDWHIDVIPLPGWKNLLGGGAGSQQTRENIPVEFERAHARAFTAFGFAPAAGDLSFVSGRWIVDCGHSYKTEIHPPSVVAIMKTIPHQGTIATKANIWVNGFYSGDRVELKIYPPPRPSPDAVLNSVKSEGNPIGGITVENPPSLDHVRVQFSAPPRQVPITIHGEMKFETGRDYKARWLVFWR